ncbi:hypothetical protein [Deinococcus sp. ME38]|uniref:hypothetical protein n=1 Tax=Deinococcus sp. ME38 TaxID=3400344 RepID=UPI003B58D304
MKIQDFQRRLKNLRRHIDKLPSHSDGELLNDGVVLWLYIAFHRLLLLNDICYASACINKDDWKEIETSLFEIDAVIDSHVDIINKIILNNQFTNGINTSEHPLSFGYIHFIIENKGSLTVKNVGGGGNLWRRWWNLSEMLCYKYLTLDYVLKISKKGQAIERRNVSGNSWAELEIGSDSSPPWEIKSDFRRFRN